jgi:4-amino-4-deoxy-L-arabinose transferase-like glycosyltransferase
VAVASIAFYLALGLAFLPLPGIQDDEVLFTAAIFRAEWVEYKLTILGHHIPLMLMSYVGALKAYLLYPVFALFGCNVWTLRLPVLLLSALSIALTGDIVRRKHSTLAALLVMALLGTDLTLATTSVCDWGPVVFQHFAIACSLWLVTRFGNAQSFALAGMLLGLGLWNKTTMVWPLVGLAAGSLLYTRDLLRISWRKWLLLSVCFLVGAAPLLWYNARTGGKTLQKASSQTAAVVWQNKLPAARDVLTGHVMSFHLFGVPTKPLSRWSASLPRENQLLVAALVAALLWSLKGSKWSRATATSLIAGWLFMAFSSEGGVAAHHVVLLWPLPHVLIACALADFGSLHARFARRVALGFAGVLVAWNLLVDAGFLIRVREIGAGNVWTNGIYQLHPELMKSQPDGLIAVGDWGVANSVEFLGGRRLNMALGHATKDLEGQKWLLRTAAMWAMRPPGHEVVPGITSELNRIASSHGYKFEIVKRIYDWQGREVFWICKAREKP